jgi:hypothetical protein
MIRRAGREDANETICNKPAARDPVPKILSGTFVPGYGISADGSAHLTQTRPDEPDAA